jgi:hypothetical protein
MFDERMTVEVRVSQGGPRVAWLRTLFKYHVMHRLALHMTGETVRDSQWLNIPSLFLRAKNEDCHRTVEPTGYNVMQMVPF